MKLLLIGFLAVQITAVVCTYRGHGSTSRNPASFLLRKVCVEVAGMKEKVVGLEEKVVGLEEKVVGLEDENAALKEKVTGLEEKVAGMEDGDAALKVKVTGLEEKVAGLEDGNAALKLPVDGQWAGWLQWSHCSNNCGPGTRTRQRQCLDPRPSNGGSNCTGSDLEMRDCEIPGCKDPTSAFATNNQSPTYVDNVVVWAFAHLNIGQHYDGTTGEYSAPYNGTYMFQLHMYKKDQAGMVSCRLRKNTGTIATAIVPSETVKQGIYESSTSAIVLLKEGDKVYVGDCDNFENMNYLTAFNGVLLDKD